MQRQENNPETLTEVASFHKEMKARAAGKPVDENELPVGNDPVEEVKAEPAIEAESAEPAQAAPAAEEPATLIKIGEKTFNSQSEAIAYAESLETDKFQADAYAQGIKDALDRVSPISHSSPTAPAPQPPEEDFDSQFYSNPKEYLAKVQARARDEAITMIKNEQRREQLWSDFFREYPDLDGQRAMCEMTLNQNWETIGKMTDIPKAMKILATKVRGVFHGYNERLKPRTELPNVPPKSVSGSPAPSVTQKEKKEAPLDFASQLRSMKKRG